MEEPGREERSSSPRSLFPFLSLQLRDHLALAGTCRYFRTVYRDGESSRSSCSPALLTLSLRRPSFRITVVFQVRSSSSSLSSFRPSLAHLQNQTASATSPDVFVLLLFPQGPLQVLLLFVARLPARLSFRPNPLVSTLLLFRRTFGSISRRGEEDLLAYVQGLSGRVGRLGRGLGESRRSSSSTRRRPIPNQLPR